MNDIKYINIMFGTTFSSPDRHFGHMNAPGGHPFDKNCRRRGHSRRHEATRTLPMIC